VIRNWYEEVIINMKEKHMKKLMSLALLCAALAVPIQSDGWVAAGGRGGFVAAGGPCWHAGWSCGGVSTGTAVAAGVAGLAVGAAIGAAAASPTYVVAPAPVVVAPVAVAPVVVPPAIGAIYYSLPYGAQSTIIHGQQYYVSGSICYRPYFGNNGVYYEVVPYPI
jgi:hypothetical protein